MDPYTPQRYLVGGSPNYPAKPEVEEVARRVEQFERAAEPSIRIDRPSTIVDKPTIRPDRLALYWELRNTFKHFKDLMRELEQGNHNVAKILPSAADRLAKSTREFCERLGGAPQ